MRAPVWPHVIVRRVASVARRVLLATAAVGAPAHTVTQSLVRRGGGRRSARVGGGEPGGGRGGRVAC
eukprot:4088663-Pleurochrysis_carterae.AAC.3